DAVRLSQRYITERQLPDKGVSLLDTACARVGLSQHATPAAVEDCKRDIESSEVAIGILQREQAVGAAHHQRLEELLAHKKEAEARLVDLEKRWQDEKKLVEQIRDIRTKLEKHVLAENKADKATDRLTASAEEKLKGELESATTELRRVQGDSGL